MNFGPQTLPLPVSTRVASREIYDKLRSDAPVENMFPGHDSKMLTDFPKIAEDITQLA